MKQDQHSTASEKQRRLYYAVLSMLALVTVGAVVVTMVAGNREAEPQPMQYVQESEPQEHVQADESRTEVIVPEDSGSKETAGNPVRPNSSIEEVKADSSEEESTPEESSASAQASQEEVREEETQTAAVFDVENDTMVWPVSGNVVMEYSADALIYDETLDQYRVNNSISIAAREGEEVVAAAAGTVKSIGANDVLGNYVVISHGNGLETTYGQLQEAVDVTVDQVVDKGETIGYIAEPTWYSLMLGTHVQFQVTQDGVAVDPGIYLESTLDE